MKCEWYNNPWLNTAGPALLAGVLILGGAGWMFLIFIILLAAFMEWIFRFREPGPLPPYLFMAFSPVLLVGYSSIVDFRIRAVCFILFSYIVAAAVRKAANPIRFSLNHRRPVTVWLVAFLALSLSSFILYRQGAQLSGDEPHYVMIAQSIVNDGDFDLKNNFDGKTYLEYIPVEVKFHGGDYNGKYLSFHLPGVSFLLIPFYWLYKVLGAPAPPALYFRLVASVYNAFFMTVLFYLLRMSFTGKDVTRIWLLFLTTFPLLLHGVHLFPELPAAALTAAAYYRFRSSRPNPLLTGLLLAPVPWFHVKYIPLLAVLAGVIVFDMFKPFRPFKLTRERVRRLVLFCVFPFISFVLLVWYSRGLYGAWSPTDIFPRESYWSTPFLLKAKVFLSYFLDQRDGLLFYAPLFFIVFWAFRRKFQHRGVLSALALVYVGFHAFTTVRGAYSPAGRPLMYISWILCLWVARYYFYYVVENPQWVSRFMFRLLAGLSYFFPVWFFYYPQFMYQPVFSYTQERASGLSLFLGSGAVPLENLFPSFLTVRAPFHIATYAWLILLVFLLFWRYRRSLKRVETPVRPLVAFLAPLALFLTLVLLYCLWPHVRLSSQGRYAGGKMIFYNFSRNFQRLQDAGHYRMKAGGRYELFIESATKPRESLTLTIKTETPGTDVAVRTGRRTLMAFSGATTSARTEIRPEQLSVVNLPGRRVWHLEIDTAPAAADGSVRFVQLILQ